eukprot:GHRQ01031331.1.p2 GENE.GHRQ01031331.1~~GHRQ01031331.1.p2  ORF type:complete len:119 (+),score=54.11 GHRQ01031331.1:218-574(+)
MHAFAAAVAPRRPPPVQQKHASQASTRRCSLTRRDIVPLGKVRANFNFSLDNKRVLNFENVVTDDDNVKQDMSIDVYGRGDKKARDEAMAAAAAAEAEDTEKAKQEQEAEELDALLAM